MVIYRPGAVTADQIREVAGAVEIYRESGQLEADATRGAALAGRGTAPLCAAGRGWCWLRAPLAELGARLAEAARD